MLVVPDRSSVDLFGEWAARKSRKGARRPAAVDAIPDRGGLRFAFYGRTSTVRFQHWWTSYRWQREVAGDVIAGAGVIVAEFFDVGCSREVPWSGRPWASALLAAVEGGDCGFDEVAVGEYERVFCGDQFAEIVPLLEARGVAVWLPEAGGRVDVDDPVHQALMVLLGAQSRREVVRSRHRTLAAMRVQACEQGRYLGGRPPYGYRLVDAGPHPTRAHAAWGRRARRLDPDPVTAPHVRWIFAQRLSGASVAGIARDLNERGVPCPSLADRDRNLHRSGEGWTVNTVASILENPRYTGRQVWNRHAAAGPEDGWAVSREIGHPELVSDADFVAAQAIRASRPTSDGSVRVYLLAGLVRCGLCQRRMDSHRVNGRAGYRCRHGHSSAKSRARTDRRTCIYAKTTCWSN